MSRYQVLVLAQGNPGREAEFRTWYDEHHVPDIRKVPGVVSVQRFDIEQIRTALEGAPQWHSITVFEIEAEEPGIVLDEIRRRAQAGEMVMTDTQKRDATVLVVGVPSPGDMASPASPG